MRDLRVVDISDSTIVAVDAQGEEFHIALDESHVSRLRSPRNEGTVIKASPKEIQALIRAGLSAAEVAQVSGATREDIERYEAPVIAEREFVLSTALATLTILEDGETGVPFGTHVRDRLESLGAIEQRWASWKDSSEGWMVKVEFNVKGVDHDARWGFDSRRGSLTPLNGDATTLSQRGELGSGIVPKLRAVDVMTGAIPSVNDSGPHTRRIPTSPVFSEVSESIRTGAITVIPTNPPAEPVEAALPAERIQSVTELPKQPAAPASTPLRDDTEPDSEDRPSTPTADLLEALRKRRQSNDDAPAWLTDSRVESTMIPEETVENPISNDVLNAVAIEISDTSGFAPVAAVSETDTFDSSSLDTAVLDAEPLTDTGRQRRARKARPTLPAWDNIVFGRPADE